MSEHIVHLIELYLDEELEGEERQRFEEHVAQCAECRVRLEREQRFMALLAHARPLYTVPEGVRRHIEQLWARPSGSRMRVFAWALGVVAVVLAVFVFRAYVYDSVRRSWADPGNRRSEFALLAVDTHQRWVRGQLPLEILSQSPEEISAWFADKVPFNLKLPSFRELPGQPKPYQLEGARLVGFKNDYAAYITYRMRNRPISLLVTSETVARPSGGEEIRSQGLVFHFEEINGWKVLSWSDRGLTYALVSDFEERGQASCMVCHPSASEQHKLEGLRR
ncbi:MAG: zf-HC2 domain-containing protein [Blastocatellia bacterium]|nr:zf-HC2 domain-containing protein [Blastocatellia bacterium]MCS7156524.1 zf-HC2 domain-containing protein [Blastocatellia bacterium]MCX7751735.1 zf-HC2 domain-containing protein [Blastocatellia bacterium]MDW8168836.1 zf-HC2 domain-containing protein [Acidobacteriota bacterium]MDW8257450.1 zf-HC2 domain-containing protein [Acidobacteriota bacterium]